MKCCFNELGKELLKSACGTYEDFFDTHLKGKGLISKANWRRARSGGISGVEMEALIVGINQLRLTRPLHRDEVITLNAKVHIVEVKEDDTEAEVRQAQSPHPQTVSLFVNDSVTPASRASPDRMGLALIEKPNSRVMAGVVAFILLLAAAALSSMKRDRQPSAAVTPGKHPAPVVEALHGYVDVLVERTDEGGVTRLLRLNEPDALPIKASDKFRIDANVTRPAYLYLIWIDPNNDVTPVYPWRPEVGWGSRPDSEKTTTGLQLPEIADRRYTAPDAQSGVASIVLLATDTPIPGTDDDLQVIFSSLPELPLPKGQERGAVWFENYHESSVSGRLRTFSLKESDDPFASWQRLLQQHFGNKTVFQASVSFARVQSDRERLHE